jgi:hypothetical protein
MKAKNFLTNGAAVSFSRNILMHAVNKLTNLSPTGAQREYICECNL